MAKRERDELNGQSTFVLEAGAWGKVTSHVGSLDIDDANGTTHSFGKDNGMMAGKRKRVVVNGVPTGEVKEVIEWRFKGDRYVPFPRTASDMDGLIASISAFANDLVAYDAADSFVTPDGTKGSKKFKILVNSKGVAITPAEYILSLLNKSHSLEGQQKVMQSKLRDIARATLASENNIVLPTGKVRAPKDNSGLVDEEGEVASDL